MSARHLKLVVRDTGSIKDAVLSKSSGGKLLERGLKDELADRYPDVDVEIVSEPSSGLRALRTELESGDSSLIGSSTDVVLLSVADEVERFASGQEPNAVAAAVKDDLLACIKLIKSKVEAHILVANLSSIDPQNPIYTYHGLDAEPFTLCAQRLNLVLIGASHEEGISIIDVDRKIAEAGGGATVVSGGIYNEAGSKVVLNELIRVLDDYGFLDDRPLMEQIGAKTGGTA